MINLPSKGKNRAEPRPREKRGLDSVLLVGDVIQKLMLPDITDNETRNDHDYLK
ncbi:unnamed protein product [Amoebophrya sp. A25]|nr:unnamed protein product [Amoebophrya sp. A25]|eukprot:GSA25T00002882001.1